MCARALRVIGSGILVAGVSVLLPGAAPASEPSGVAGWAVKMTPSLAARVHDPQAVLSCIVTLEEPFGGLRALGARERTAWIERAADGLEADLAAGGVVIRRRFSQLPLLAVQVPAASLAALGEHPGVRAVTPQRKARVQRTEGKQLMRVPEVHALGHRGAGVGIAILDTGVDYNHAELSPAGTKTIKLHDAIANDSDPMDEEGHGTAVAAIAAGSGNGVAPDAVIVAVRVLDENGEGTSEQVLAGIDAVLASIAGGNPHNIRVVNLSLGGYDDDDWPPAQGSCDALSTDFAAAFGSLVDAGALVTVAAGNGGCSTGVSWPACISHAVAVGAVYDANVGYQIHGKQQCNPFGCFDMFSGADQITCYSDSGEKLSVWAPSHCAKTARKGGGNEDCFGGTSAAAPYVAGVAALLTQAVPQRPVSALRQAIESTGAKVKDARNNVERRRVNAQEALSMLQTGCVAPVVPSGLLASRSAICSGEVLTLSWGALTGAASYTVQVADSPSFAAATDVSSSSPTLDFSTNRSTAATLFFRVRAEASCGASSGWSSAVQVSYSPTCSGPSYARSYFVSGIARLPGVPPADWYSDLAVLNTSTAAADIRLSFYGNAALPAVTSTLQSRQQLTWSNVLPTLFGLAGQDVGAIVVESTQPLQVTARTYSRLVEGSTVRTYGQSYDGMEVGRALTAGGVGYLPGLRSDGQFRTNVELVNVGETAATVEVRFFNNGGVALGQPLSLTVQPKRRAAATRALPSGHAAAFAEVRITSQNGRVIGFASVVDGNSGDPTTVAMGGH